MSLIDRGLVMFDYLQRLGRKDTYKAKYEALADAVDNANAVDAVPVVHAKWTGGKYYNGTYGYEKTCTNCKKEYVVVYGYLFCPYCGARMDGEIDA